MTVRLAQDVGMPLIVEYARRFGVYDNLPTYPVVSRSAPARPRCCAWSPPIRCSTTAASASFRPSSTASRTATAAPSTSTTSANAKRCKADKWKDQAEPSLVDRREQVIDPMTAYQITSIMEGVVQRGTATVVRSVGKPIAGKTGTTNDEKDVWFIGYSPDIAVGVYMGYDKPRHIGRGATGGHLAAPIVADFLKVALADKPAVPFRVPSGIKLIRVDAKTGMRAGPGDSQGDPGGVQARHRAARRLFGDRLDRPAAAGSRLHQRAAGCRPRRAPRHRAVLIGSLPYPFDQVNSRVALPLGSR